MATKKNKRRVLALRLGSGTDHIRYVQFIHKPAGPDNAQESEIVSSIESRFSFLNEKIKDSIQTYLDLFNESGPPSNVSFGKSNELMEPDYHDLSVYLSPINNNHHHLYRVVFDFVGGKIGVNFDLEDKEHISETLSHLVGVSNSKTLEIHGSSGPVDTIIYANLTLDAVLTILHDIALDIFFFHHYFDPLIGDTRSDIKPTVRSLKDFSASKVRFAIDNNLSFYGNPATQIHNANNLTYVSFASACRKGLILQHFDYKEYRRLWLGFLHTFSLTSTPSSWPGSIDLLSEQLVSHILSLKYLSGQLSRSRLKGELIQFLSSEYVANSRLTSAHNTIVLVVTTVRPTENEKRGQIASYLNFQKWRKNQWRFFYNPPEKTLNGFLPYVQILKLNIP